MSMYNMEDIARFVEGDMDDTERAGFEEALIKDPALQSELAFYKHVHSSLKTKIGGDALDEEFKTSLKEISSKHFESEAKVVPIRQYLAWASAIAAILVLFFVWAPWNNNLYRQYADTQMLAVAERGNNGEQDMQQAVQAFNKKDFNSAKVFLRKITIAEPDNTNAQFYYAIALLETDEIIESRKILTSIYRGSSIFKYDAAFYTALSFLKERNKGQAIEWLKKVPADASNYEESQELLGKLK